MYQEIPSNMCHITHKPHVPSIQTMCQYAPTMYLNIYTSTSMYHTLNMSLKNMSKSPNHASRMYHITKINQSNHAYEHTSEPVTNLMLQIAEKQTNLGINNLVQASLPTFHKPFYRSTTCFSTSHSYLCFAPQHPVYIHALLTYNP